MTSIRVLLSRALDVVFSRRRERRLEEEIANHLQLLTDQYIAAGMAPADARLAARRAFGGIDQMKEAYRDQRGLPLADALAQDIRFAVRLMRRNPGFTLTAVLVLGLGIGVNNMLFTILNAHTLRGLPIRQSDRVLLVGTVDDRGRNRGLSFAEYQDVAADVQHYQGLAAFRAAPMILAGDDRAAERLDGAFATANTFELIGVRPVLGRTFGPADDQPGAAAVALLSETAWTTRYGADPAALGRPVTVDGVPATLVGVIPDRSGFPGTATMWRPLRQAPGLAAETRDARTLQVFGRLRDGARVDDAAAEIAGLGDRFAAAHPGTNAKTRLLAVPINDRFLGNPRDTVWVAFMTVGFIVLLISCANVANLMIDRSLLRTRELAIRASVGGTAGRLARQLLVEGAALATTGAAVGLLVAIAGVRGFRAAIPGDALPYWLDYSIDWRVVSALIGVAVLTVFVFALVPALQASKTDAMTVIKDGGRAGSRGRRRVLATTFMAAQLALSIVLLSHFAVNVRTGGPGLATDAIFERSDIVTAAVSLPAAAYPTPTDRVTFYQTLLDRVRVLPGVEAAAVTTALPASGGEPMPFVVEGSRAKDEHAERTALVISTTADHFRALGLELLQGRMVRESDGNSGEDNAVVNERFAQSVFPGENAIGRRISLSGSKEAGGAASRWLTIVGVAPTIRQQRGNGEEPVVYLAVSETAPANAAMIVRSSLATAGVVSALREQVRAIDRDLPIYRARTLPQVRHDMDWNGRISSRLFTFLTFIAVLLAAIGLYAVTAQSVTQESQEIGIRVALGARPRQIVGRVLRRLVGRTAIGFGAGILLTMLWDRRLGSGSTDVRATDLESLLIVAGILLAVVVMAAVVPARRATRLDPLTAIRSN